MGGGEQEGAKYGNRNDCAFMESLMVSGEKIYTHILTHRGDKPTAGMTLCLFSTTVSKQGKSAGILP